MMNVDQQLNDVVRWPCVSKRAAINKVPIIAKYAIAATVTLINDYNDNSDDDDDAQMQLAATTTRTTTPTSLSSSSSRLRGEPQQQQQQQLKYDDEDDASNHNQNHPAVNAASSCIDITTNNTSATAITNNNSYTNRNHYSSNSSQLLQHSLQLISSTMFNLALSFRIIFLLAVINSSLVVAVSGVAAVDASHPHNVLDDDAVVYGHFTPTWAVHIPEGRATAERVAHDHGFTILGDIFDDHYHFHHSAVSKRSTDASDHHQLRLDDDDRVHWSKQQRIKSRSKRDFLRMRTARITPWASSLSFNDEKWEQMWYLRRGKNLDMNVLPAWKEGITGRGVVVTILDDGLEVDHPDLLQNYDPKASHDVNSNDEDPMPHYDLTDSNRHGTRCAGEVAATANNSICAVGIAYNARVGGVRMLDGEVTDAVEARSLSFSPQHIDIYSASWGPDDDGKTVDGPGEMATKAFIEGVTKGRNGKGSIFVWASGNGGREHDNCNCDGYTNSIWTLSISSATERGNVPWYSEKCSSTLATTYSSGGTFEKQVITTDLHHSCTGSHTGTSASAPLAAGIVALVLEANRNLTWRDLQHIVVRTAKPMNLNDTTWIRNGVGRLVSHSFGYGLMDAYNMVKLARTWKTVPEQQRCEINAPHLDKSISSKSYLTLQLDVEHCRNVNYLEHVQAKITLTSQRRGDIQIYLKSPAGTRVNLLTSRSHDVSRSGFNQWPFMSVHTWGESPHGNWQLEIHNEGMFMAQITHWDLICYGTETPSQPGDQPFYNEGKTAGLDNLNNLEHNSLEMEADNGKWHVLHQQVGENHVDVQRTTLNDQTGTACLKFAPNQTCIECLRLTYLFEGRCYTTCPERTFMQPQQTRDIELTTTTTTTAALNTQRSPPLNYINDDRRHHSSVSLRNDNSPDPMPRRRSIVPDTQPMCCQPCHFSCLTCHGPNDYNCLTCAPDAVFTQKATANEAFCYPLQPHPAFDIRFPFDYSKGVILYAIAVASGLVFVCYIGVVMWRRTTSVTKKHEYAYDSVCVEEDVQVRGIGAVETIVVDSCSESDGEPEA